MCVRVKRHLESGTKLHNGSLQFYPVSNVTLSLYIQQEPQWSGLRSGLAQDRILGILRDTQCLLSKWGVAWTLDLLITFSLWGRDTGQSLRTASITGRNLPRYLNTPNQPSRCIAGSPGKEGRGRVNQRVKQPGSHKRKLIVKMQQHPKHFPPR